MSPRIVAACGSIALALGGCGAGMNQDAFNYRFADNLSEPTAAVVARIPAPAPPSSEESPLGHPIAVLSTDGTPGSRAVACYDLSSGEQLWSTPAEPLTRPEVHGDVVVFSARAEDDPEQIVALDLRNGTPLWHRSTHGQAFVGADREGSMLVYVVSVGAAGGATRKSTIAGVDARSGSEAWSHDLEGVLGAPAVTGGMAFVPWERQNIAILGLSNGVEQARLRSTDDVIWWVDATPAGVFYGQRGIYRLTPQSYLGTKAGATYHAPFLPEAPREPLVHEDGFMPKPGTRSARGRIRIYAEPDATSTEGEIPLVGETIYFAYYRYIFGYDTDEHLRWVRILDQTVADAQVTPRGLLTIGEQGGVHLLARETGNDLYSGGIEAEIASVSLIAPGFDGGAGGEPGEVRDLRTSLNEVALDPDNRLVPARAYAIDMLSRMEEPEITRDLLDLYAQRSMPGALRTAIGESLEHRSAGSEFLIQALDQHYDYINDTKAPPLALIVPSLRQMGASQAVPGLIQQMMDHETPPEVLPIVVEAVVALGDESTVPPLREFLRLYHADSTFAEHPEALYAAARGVFERGGPEGRELLTSLAAEGRTLEPLAANVRGLFEAEQRGAERAARAEAEAAAAAAAEAAREEVAARPLRLSQEAINQTFAEHADDLRECIVAEIGRNPRLAQVRFVFILDAEGNAQNFTFAPNNPEFVSCITPKVASIEFPKFRQRRQRATFTISVRGNSDEQQASNAPLDDSDQPWWVRFRARTEVPAPMRAATDGPPWWVRRPAEEPTMPEPPVVANHPPTGQPPTGQPPTGQPPTGQPPTGQPPTGQPPAGHPPAEHPPTGQPPTGQPPTGQPPTEHPPAEHPPEHPTEPTPPPEEPENPWWLPAE